MCSTPGATTTIRSTAATRPARRWITTATRPTRSGCCACARRKSGGLSKIVSSVRLHNEVLRRRPDLFEALTQPYCWTKHGEMEAGERPYYESPAFNFLDGKLCTAFGPQHMIKGHALPARRA